MTKTLRPLVAVLGLLVLGACAGGPSVDFSMPGERPGFEGVDYRDIGR